MWSLHLLEIAADSLINYYSPIMKTGTLNNVIVSIMKGKQCGYGWNKLQHENLVSGNDLDPKNSFFNGRNKGQYAVKSVEFVFMGVNHKKWTHCTCTTNDIQTSSTRILDTPYLNYRQDKGHVLYVYIGILMSRVTPEILNVNEVKQCNFSPDIGIAR